jgi:signal transduction histidine kinase
MNARTVVSTPSTHRHSPRARRGADELLAVFCHEMRSPIAAVRYAADAWSSQVPDATRQDGLQAVIERQTARMTRLIDDLLDASRALLDPVQLHCETIDLRRVVDDAIASVAPDVDACGQQLTSCAPAEPVWVKGDSFRLEQVFVNLLGNACKYSSQGGHIEVIIQVLETNEGLVRVRDSGIGIDAQFLPHVFDLYRRGEQSAIQRRPGLGIGLAIVRDLVELHGGRVTATSHGTGEGSEFAVRLPGAG